MDIFKVCILAVVAVILISILNQYNKTFAILASTMNVIIIVMLTINAVEPIIFYVNEIIKVEDFSNFACIVKAIGLGIIAQTASDFCEESGQVALANKVILFGKIAIVFVCLPLFEILLEIVKSLL
ncbi:MAG: stage III sporulation AC/AD family protein [Oscillospiraceae bacterium]